MNKQKRVAAIHDISGFGKCSLTVALPIISATGIETTVLPTAVLSTHTGGITGYTYRDLTGDLRPIADHWQSLGIEFDAIYSGFLGSFEQIAIVKEFVERFRKKDTIFIADPAMADQGKMYPIFDRAFATEMAGLCAMADVVVPNFTEAAFMLDEEYVPGPYTKEYVEGLLRRLSAMGPSRVVLTGVHFDDTLLGAASYDRNTDTVSYSFDQKVPGYYHGTGDIYASVLVGALMNDFALADAAKIAVHFTQGCIQRTQQAGTDIRFGVNFEAGLPKLMQDLHLI